MRKKIIIPFVMAILAISGCTVASESKEFENIYKDDTNKVGLNEVKTVVPLEEAIIKTQSNLVKQYWFRSHIANNIEKRRSTYMTLDGVVINPDGYYMRNTLVTQPFDFYQWNNHTYIRQNDNWFHGRTKEVPFETTFNFDSWMPLLNRSEIVRVDDVLGVPTIVHQIELTGDELLELEHPFAKSFPSKRASGLSNILKNTNVQVLFYIGDISKSTSEREILPIIYKHQVWIQMPIPDAGYMEQEIQHFLFRVNSENIEMLSVEDIERYVINIEDARELMDRMSSEELMKIKEQIEN